MVNAKAVYEGRRRVEVKMVRSSNTLRPRIGAERKGKERKVQEGRVCTKKEGQGKVRSGVMRVLEVCV